MNKKILLISGILLFLLVCLGMYVFLTNNKKIDETKILTEAGSYENLDNFKTIIKNLKVNRIYKLIIEGQVDKLNYTNTKNDAIIEISQGSKVTDLNLNTVAKVMIDSEIEKLSVARKVENIIIQLNKNSVIKKIEAENKLELKGSGKVNEFVTKSKTNITGSVKPDNIVVQII